MAYPNDRQYDPYPRMSPINEPDPDVTRIELICSYPDIPGVFVTPPFYAGEAGPFQVYVHTITKIQDVLIDLADIYWEDVKLSNITGIIPSYYEEQKTSYFPSQCAQQWGGNIIVSEPLILPSWSAMVGWTSSTFDIGNCLVILKDLNGNFWPQYQNWRDQTFMGTLTYHPGTCVDWQWMNPSDSSKILHIKTPHTSGAHLMYDCRQFRYSWNVYQYIPSARRVPSIVPTVAIMMGGLLFTGNVINFTPKRKI